MRPTLLTATLLALSAFSCLEAAADIPAVAPGDTVSVEIGSVLPKGSAIYIDDQLADAFARVDGSTITVTPPFLTQGTHRIEIRDASGRTLTEQAFRIESETGVFDSVKRAGSIDLATTQTVVNKSDTDREGHSGLYDLRAAGEVIAKRGKWAITASGEVIGAERASRSPFDEHAIDASRIELAARYEGEDIVFDAAVGDLTYQGRNELIASGIAGRGARAAASIVNERVKISAGMVSGVNVIGWRQGGEAPDSDNMRAAADATVALLREGPVTLSVTASALHARRKLSAGFGVSGLDDGEENTVVGLGANATAFDGRMRYQGRFAHARYDNPAALNAGISNPGGDRGNAQTHRVEADLLEGDLTVTVDAGYARTDLGFRSIEAGAFPDRTTVDGGIGVSYGNFDLTARVAEHKNNLDNIAQRLSTDTRSIEGALSYQFETEGDAKGIVLLKPASVEISASRTTLSAANGDDYLKATGFGPDSVPNQTETTFGAALDWSTPAGETGIGYDLSLFDQSAAGIEAADTVEHAVSISHGLRGEDWSVEGYASINWGRDEDPFVDGKSKSVDWGIRARVAPEGWPELSVAYDRGRAHDVYRAYGERETGKTERLSVNLNLTPAIEHLDLPVPVNMTVGYQMSRNSTRSTGFSAAQDDQRFKLNVSARF